jgi:pSer/pThr/pTyr-binding forkhead associated (FHA) protein
MLRIVVERAGEIIQDALFDKPLVSVGKSADNDVRLDSPSVSSLQLLIKRGEGRFHLLEQGLNPSRIEGSPISWRAEFVAPTVVHIPGGFELTLIPVAQHDQTTREEVSLHAITEVDQTPESTHTLVPLEPKHPAELRLLLRNGETTVIPFNDTAMIGRTSDCDLRLTGADVSRHHCLVYASGPDFFLRRLSSTNGVSVCGREVAEGETVALRDGDEIALCGEIIVFVTTPAAARPIQPMADARPNHDLAVHRRVNPETGVSTFELIGFLGMKTSGKLETEILHEVRRLERVIIDLGYLIGLDAAGIVAIGKVLSEAAKHRCSIRLIRVAPRVVELLESSPLRSVVMPYVSRSEDSAVKAMRS